MSHRSRAALLALPFVLASASLAACGSDDSPQPVAIGGSPATSFDHGGASAATGGAGGSTSGPPGTFVPPADPGGGGVVFSVSGEALAHTGYGFPPKSLDDVVFVDGWEIDIQELLVTVDAITLSSDPDTDPTDQSKTGGAVAQLHGPWAIDLHPTGALPGKGGAGETAVPIAALSGQNLNGGAPFDPSVKYAFGFDTVAASAGAVNVNLSSQAQADYQEMIQKGYVVFYVGTATFRGGTSCATTDATYDFTQLPTTVPFRLGFTSPTTYVNCQNPDLAGGGDNENEEHPRGVQVTPNASIVAQVTIHTDHPFWESTIHDSPAHFDFLAARLVGQSGGDGTVTTEMLRGVDVSNVTDGAGHDLPWRDCASAAVPGYYNLPTTAGKTFHFDPQSVPVDPGSPDGSELRDVQDFVTYDQSTQGHLNSDGLCAVHRNYPSPP